MQPPFTIADLLTGLADLGMSAEKDLEKVCPGCGLSYIDFRKSGRLGCDRCYMVFEKSLHRLFESIHKSTKHVGKVPLRARRKVNELVIIRELEEKLRAAVEKEEFEKAARLRDKIQEAKKGSRGKRGSRIQTKKAK